MICPNSNCQQTLRDDAAFCPYCGTAINPPLQQGSKSSYWWVWVLLIGVLIWGVFKIGGCGSDTKTDSGNNAPVNKSIAYLGEDIKAYQLDRMLEYPAAGSFKISGVEYKKGLVNEYEHAGMGGTAFYKVDGKYTSMSGVCGPVDGTQQSGTITIYGDGNELQTFEIDRGDLAQPFQIDITGVSQIKVVSEGNVSSAGYYALANVVLSKSGSAYSQLKKPQLDDNAYLGDTIKAYQLDRMREYPAEGSFTIAGIRYRRGIVNQYDHAGMGGTAFYNLDGKYKTMAGIYGPVDGTQQSGSIIIYGDGRELGCFSVARGDLAKPFQVDVTGVSQIKVVSEGSTLSAGYYALADVVLSKSGSAAVRLKEPKLRDNAYLGENIKAYQLDRMLEYPGSGSFTIAGTRYRRGIVNQYDHAGMGGTAFYLVSGGYRSMSGIYGPVDGTGQSGTITVYGDGRKLQSFIVKPSDPVKPFQIDITGISQIKVTSEGSVLSAGYYALADVVLKK